MRYLIVPLLGVCLFSSDCSVLEQIQLGEAPHLDPNKVYPDGRPLYVSRYANLDRYDCVSGPLLCTQWGRQWKCRCP